MLTLIGLSVYETAESVAHTVTLPTSSDTLTGEYCRYMSTSIARTSIRKGNDHILLLLNFYKNLICKEPKNQVV